MTPYYEDELTTIYHGDCVEVMQQLEPTFDLVLTSPPYNKGLRVDGRWAGRVTASSKGSRFREGYGKHSDMMPMDVYEIWQRQCLSLMWGLLNEYGAVFYNHKPRVLNGELWTPLSLVPAGVPLRQIVTWHVGAGINVMPTAFTPAYEWLLVFAQKGWRIELHHSARGDVWKIPPVKMADHPAPFPVALAAKVLDVTGAETVLDPFVGSGSTLLAAKTLGRKAIGIEIEERYCEIAANRLSQEVLAL